uniref:Uncharacterized protein n=1 Tax=Oryza nivara TaxID=4536 RepID=A0A0E0IBB3_ORYNI
MESEDKLDLILRRMEEFERRRVEADQRRRAEYQSLKAAVESWMPEIHKNAEDLQILVGDEQSKCPNGSSPSTTARSIYDDEGTTPTIILELGDGEDKIHDPDIVAKVSLEVTPTMCSMKCSVPDTESNLIMVAEVTYASTATVSMELVAAQEAIGATYSDTSDHSKLTHTKCLTVVLDAIGDTVHKIFWSVMIKSVRHVPSISSELDDIQGKSTRIFIVVKIPEGCNPKKSSSATTETQVSHLFNSFSELLDVHLTTTEMLVSKRSQEVRCWQGALELQVSVIFWLLARNIHRPKFEVQVLEFLLRVLIGSLSEKYSGNTIDLEVKLNHSHKTIIVHLLIRNKLKTWISEMIGRTDRVDAKFTIVCQLSRSLQSGTHILDLYSAEEHIFDNFLNAIMWCSVPIKNLHKQWDPGGSGDTLHRLGDKPKFKERRLLGTQMGCLWAVNHFQSKAETSKSGALYKQQE